MRLDPWLLFPWLAFSACLPRESSEKAPQASATVGPVKPCRYGQHRVLEAQKRGPTALAANDILLTGPFHDTFERPKLGDYYRSTSQAWRIEGGRLCVKDARNQPLWLARRLPANAEITFSAVSDSEDGDIKCEAWGDGASSATEASYTNATSYLFIFGGWKNRYHVLARPDEHGDDRLSLVVTPDAPEFRRRPVELGKTYRFRIERRDRTTLRWWLDDQEMFAFSDKEPLHGAGHDHFAFNDWSARLCFDDLTVTPLPD